MNYKILIRIIYIAIPSVFLTSQAMTYEEAKLNGELFGSSAIIQGQELLKSSKVEDVPSYQKSVEEEKYYGNLSSIEQDSIKKNNEDEYKIHSITQSSYSNRKRFDEESKKIMNSQKHKNIKNNPNETINDIEEDYRLCKTNGGSNGDDGSGGGSNENNKTEAKVCDEISNQVGYCYIGKIIQLDDKTTYKCSKIKDYYNKRCNRKINMTCEKEVSCIKQVNVSYSTMNFNVNSDNKIIQFSNSQRNISSCYIQKEEIHFNIKDVKAFTNNKDSIFKLTHIKFDDFLRITVNGKQIINHPYGGNSLYIDNGKMKTGDKNNKAYQCEIKADYDFNPNIDLKPFLKEGVNKVVFEIGFAYDGTRLNTVFKVDGSCCDSFKENESIECTRDLAIVDVNEEIIQENNEKSQEACSEKINEKCIESGSKLLDNKYQVFKDCWNYETNYSCTQGKFSDFCKTINKIPSCNKMQSNCLSYDDSNNNNESHKDNEDNQNNSVCNHIEEEYVCGSMKYYQNKEKEIILDLSHSLMFGDVKTEKLCDFGNNKSESLQHCDIISNVTGERSCYLGIKKNSCNNYEEYDKQGKCSLHKATCLDESSNQQNNPQNCKYKEKIYHCVKDWNLEGGLAGDDEDGQRVINGDGNDSSNEQSSNSITCSNQEYCLEEDCSEEVNYEAGSSLPKVVTYLKSLEQMNNDSDTDTLEDVRVFTGESLACEKDVFSYSDCCKDSGWGQDLNLASCSYEEQSLGRQKEKGYCVYLGSYCSEKEKITGTCLKKKQSYCCFGLILSRIIQQEGREQIEINFGSSKEPNCRGFIIEEMQTLNFEKMDFNEYSQSLILNLQDLSIEDIENSIIQEVEESLEN